MIRDLRGSLRGTHPELVFPRYDGWSFANIPETLLRLFGAGGERTALDPEVPIPLASGKPRQVLLVLIDGLGFDNWVERAVRFPFFRLLGERGEVASLTAVFPSTTSASLTTLSTGLTPMEHGCLEWNLYLEEIDDVVVTLPFKRWNGRERDGLAQEGFDAKVLFEGGTNYERLAAAGVESVSISNRDYATSAYSRASKRGSRPVGFLNRSDLAVRIRETLEAPGGRRLVYVYWDMLDALGHAYGPYGKETESELENVSRLLLEQVAMRLDPAVARETLLLVTADHGMVDVDPKRTRYLDDVPELPDLLRSRRCGLPIFPTGSMRDVILHVRQGKVEEARSLLARSLAGVAEVWLSRDAAERGLWGTGAPSPRFRGRAGDLLILPREDATVWAQYPGAPRPHRMRGAHGGLSPREMFIPFAAAPLDALV